MDRVAKRVAAQWGFRLAMSGNRPEIPGWAFARYGSKQVEALSPEVAETFRTARDSINILLPNFLKLLRQKTGDKYDMNASQDHDSIFYFFRPPQPIDGFVVSMRIKGGVVHIGVAYTPTKLNGMLDLHRMVEMQDTVDDPDLTGLRMMNLARKVLQKVC